MTSSSTSFIFPTFEDMTEDYLSARIQWQKDLSCGERTMMRMFLREQFILYHQALVDYLDRNKQEEAANLVKRDCGWERLG